MFHKVESEIIYGTAETPKAKSVVYKCKSPAQVLRFTNGEFAIFAIVRTNKENEIEELGLIRLSEETYNTEIDAKHALVNGQYTLNKDYKSFHEYSLTEHLQKTHTSVLPCEHGLYMLGYILYEEHYHDEEENGYVELAHVRQSKKTFLTKADAEKALNTGDWIHEYSFHAYVDYLKAEKLKVHLSGEGKYWLGRKYTIQYEITDEIDWGFKEYIPTGTDDKEEATKQLEEFLKRV